MSATNAPRFTNSALAAELIDYHVQQVAEAKKLAASLLQENVRAAGIQYGMHALAEDGSDDLRDALAAMKNGKLGIAEGLISATLDALVALRAELAAHNA